MKTSLIIVARNELEGIRQITPIIKNHSLHEIIVIDGNSTDGTFEECKKMGLNVIRQKSIGRGNAFREGLENASGEILIFFSPDGNENHEDIPKLISKIMEGYDLVIGSRLMEGGGSLDFTPLRKFLTNLVTRTINLLYGANYTDACNGLRAIRRSTMKNIETDAVWHEIEIQISIRCIKRGYKVTEIPTFEGERIGGTVKLKLFSTGLRHGWYLLRELFK